MAPRLVLPAICAALMAPSASLAEQDREPLRSGTEAPAQTGLKLYALILRPGAAWKPGRAFEEQGLRPHLNYWMALFRQGRVATAGPWGNDSGLVLLFARDLASAEAVARADPAVTSGIFTGEVRPYLPPMVNPDAFSRKPAHD